MRPQDNIDRLKDAIVKLENHPMCYNYKFEGTRIIVYYPEGDFQTGGVTCDIHNSKAKNIGVVIEKMETVWQENYPYKML